MSAAAVHRVFIVGDSLFAESVAELLGHTQAVAVVGMAATVDGALAQVARCQPDLILVLSGGSESDVDLGPLLSTVPDLPILRADLKVNDLRIIRSQRVAARVADLMDAIQALPTRR